MKRNQHARRAQGDATRKAILDALRGATEPVSSREILEQVKKKRGVTFTKSHVANVLQTLEAQGTVFSRLETDDEIKNRGAIVYNYGSRLYWAGGPNVPARRSAVVFPGIDISALTNSARVTAVKAYHGSRKKKAVKNIVRPGKATTMQTDSLEVFNLKIRVAELEAQLSAIKKILS